MPQFTIDLDDFSAELVAVIGRCKGRTAEELVAEWVHASIADQVRLSEEIRARCDPARIEKPKPMRERDYEIALAAQLVSRGLSVLSQVRTDKGIADLVVAGSVAVEMKLSLDSWREVHQAQGQADAYARALDLAQAVICAPNVSEEFRSATVFDVTEAADLIAAMCHDCTLADPSPNRTEFLRAGDSANRSEAN